MKWVIDRTLPAVFAAAMLAFHGAAAWAQQYPSMGASPLAGGMAAASGGSFVDAQGNRIVMPATFDKDYGPGPGSCQGGYCPDGGDGGGDGGAGDDSAYVDFGGYGPDQCGPYYYDISVAGVFLQGEDLFKDVPALGAVGFQGPKIIDPASESDEVKAGWMISPRYDLGPLSVLEANYMGLYDMGFNNTQTSATNNLVSYLSDYGNPLAGAPIAGLDEGNFYQTSYDADLQSTEFNYRRYWVGYNSRISGTYLAGFRYLRTSEDLILAANALNGTSGIQWGDINDVLGFQFGGDAWLCVLQGLRLGAEGKSGVYNNHFKYHHATAIPDQRINNVDFDTSGDHVAFAGEASVDLVADILPSFSIRAGYRVLYMSNLVTVGNNIDPHELADLTGDTSSPFATADVIYHGFHAGLEYIW